MCRDLLLVIDMQNVYASGGAWFCPKAESAAENIKSLLESEEINTDVIFTRFLSSKDPVGDWIKYNEENALVNGDPHANEMMDAFSDHLDKYPLYTKSVYSSLAIPEVRESVKDHDRVILSGVVAECCVLSTAFALIDAGVHIIYLSDAVAGINEETEKSVISVLSGLEPLHVEIMTTAEYMDKNIHPTTAKEERN